MLTKQKLHPSNYKSYFKFTNQDSTQTCICDDSTIICGTIVEIDYVSTLEDKMVIESYYGDIDLFGF